MTDHPAQTMTDDEYMRRLRARFVERGGEGADAVADGVDVDTWRKDDFADDPEGAADEEMDYWSDDGDE